MRLCFLILETMRGACGWIFREMFVVSISEFLKQPATRRRCFLIESGLFTCQLLTATLFWGRFSLVTKSLMSGYIYKSKIGLISESSLLFNVIPVYMYGSINIAHTYIYVCKCMCVHVWCFFLGYWNRECAFCEPLARKHLGTNQLNRLFLCNEEHFPICLCLLHWPFKSWPEQS